LADPDQLDQVLWALLDNAVKYGGGTPVTASIEPDAAGRAVRLTIADSGPGIAPADLDRLFERFARGTPENHADGTGLGLYVSRELCRAMGGDLCLASADGAAAGGPVPAAFVVELQGEPPEEP
jgi:signal transduction histidine kinase